MAIDVDSANGEVSKPIADEPAVESANAEQLDRDAKAQGDVRHALVIGSVMAVALLGLGGWLGYRAHEPQQARQERSLFVQVARQGALNLTTIDYTHAEADVRRILDSSTGPFREDFQKRSQPFIEVVKQSKSKSEGSIIEAGLESQEGNEARVLVAVSVRTSLAGTAEPQPRGWRMRISVQKIRGSAKVSNVEFVP